MDYRVAQMSDEEIAAECKQALQDPSLSNLATFFNEASRRAHWKGKWLFPGAGFLVRSIMRLYFIHARKMGLLWALRKLPGTLAVCWGAWRKARQGSRAAARRLAGRMVTNDANQR